MEICSSYRCAVTLLECAAARVKAKCIPQLFSAALELSSQHDFVTAITPMEICSSYRCAVTQLKCTAARVKAKCIPQLFSAALENKLTARFCHCNYTYEDLLFIHVCSDSAEMHCSAGLGKTHSPLFSADLEKFVT